MGRLGFYRDLIRGFNTRMQTCHLYSLVVLIEIVTE